MKTSQPEPGGRPAILWYKPQSGVLWVHSDQKFVLTAAELAEQLPELWVTKVFLHTRTDTTLRSWENPNPGPKPTRLPTQDRVIIYV